MSEPLDSDRPSNLVYGLEDRVPIGPALLVSFQQVASMVIGTITPALILAGILKFPAQDTAYFVSMALVASAIGTALQTIRPFGWIGAGLLSVTGTSFAFLDPLIRAGTSGGIALMFGMTLAAAPVVLLMAPVLPKLRRVLTPLVSGIVVLLIGLSLIPTGMRNIAKVPVEGAPSWGGGLVALVVIAVMVLTQVLGKPWLRLAGMFLGAATGYLLCSLLGWLPPMAPASGSWITLPKFLSHGLAFDASLLFPFAFLYLVVVLESMGDMTATSQLSGLKTEGKDYWNRMRCGVFADGLTSIASGLIGAFPSTTYAQNNGVIQMTGVASRRLGWIMALMLFALGVFPPVARVMTAMPASVLGALSILLFGLVSVSGIRLIVAGGLPQRDAIVVALSLGVGIGIPTQKEWLHTLPHFVQTFFESGVSAGGMTALVLNMILPIPAAKASESAAEETVLEEAQAPASS